MAERLDDTVIQRLLLGQLPPQQADQLCLALADDSRLTAAGRQPLPEDALLALLQSQKDRPDEPTPSRLERLAEVVRRRMAELCDETPQAPPLPPHTPEPATAPEIPQQLGNFRLLSVLGVGGMGVVYRAQDLQLNRPVALKVIRAELAARPEVRRRFLREARHGATVEHPNVVVIHQVGEVEGVPFLTMPVLQGETLETRLARAGASRPLPLAEVFRIGREAAEGLAAAHERGVVHRDIKPSNLWLQTPGEPGGARVVILDFGLSRLQAQPSTLTESGALLGTPAYMAPEQARGRAVDHRADLFSLGCVLYQMTTGRRPFPGTDPLAVLASLALDRPEPPAQVSPEVPPALSELILHLLEKDPARRPGSARELADRLAAIERHPLGHTSRRPAQRPVVGLLVGTVCLAAVLAWLLPRPSSPSAALSDRERAAAKWAVQLGGRVEFVEGNRLRTVGPGDPFPATPLPLFSVNLEFAAITDADLARLSGLPSLEYLSLSDTDVSDAALDHLAGIPKLRGLYLDRTRVSDEGFGKLGGFSALAELQAVGTRPPLTDAGTAQLCKAPGLRELGLRSEQLTGGCARHLRQCRGLEKLMLGAPLKTREALADLAALPELRDLNLSSSEMTSEALAGLAAAARLEALTLLAPRVHGDGLPALAALPKLRTLRLDGAELRPDDCRHFEPFPALEHLRLDNAGLTDEAVPALARLTRLRSLNLPHNRISAKKVRELREALPGCRVGFE